MPSDTTLAPPPPVRADASLPAVALHDEADRTEQRSDTPRTASDADVFASVLPDALDTIAQGVVVYDASDRLMYANRRFGEIYQIGAHVLQPGTARDDVVQAQARRLSRDPKRITDYLALCSREQRAPYAGVRMLPDGRSVSVTRRSLPDGTIVATHEDVTDRMGVERRIAHAAHHDALTGLPNRAHFTEQLDTAMKRVRRGDRVALLLLDLDKFKAVNDTHGHGVGDLLLAAVAAKLSAIVREADVVARLGGDEFAILQVPAATPEDAEAFAARITDEMTKPYLLAGKTIFCGISVGIALATEEMTDSAMLLQQADFALYRAKDEGRGAYRFFERELDRQFRNRRKLEADLRRALVVDELALHYQPIVNLEHARVDTIEALVRWRHNGAWVSPGQFVPLAEDTGLILPMGDWVMRQACQDAASLDAEVS
ncbi:MAG: diguanylate cyclase, partial [Pseudomonadota bacterium]